RIRLLRAGWALVSDTVYWYSTAPDALGKPNSKTSWYTTPASRYANLTGLNRLASNPNVRASVSRRISAGQETVTIRLRNTSGSKIAFFVRPEITAGNGGTEVLPVTYTDNYVSLWPGESTAITARFRPS